MKLNSGHLLVLFYFCYTFFLKVYKVYYKFLVTICLTVFLLYFSKKVYKIENFFLIFPEWYL